MVHTTKAPDCRAVLVLLSSAVLGVSGTSRVQLLRAATGGPQVVKLRRLHTRTHEGAGAAATDKAFYVGFISVGHEPQRLRVSFDTASGQVLLPSAKCKSEACIEHRRYLQSVSKSATDVNADGNPLGQPEHRDSLNIGFSSLDLGDGKATGELLREQVCLPATNKAAGPRACTELGMVAATELTDMPFRAMPNDGVVGLGLPGLSIRPDFNFLEQLPTRDLPRQFGFFMGEKGGEVAFGGHNPARLAAPDTPLSWVPVFKPDQGYWQLAIRRVSVGNRTIAACEGGCRGIVDTCASRLGVPADLAPKFEAALGGCLHEELRLELENNMMLILQPEDYVSACKPRLAPLQLPESFANVFLLGEPLLRRYYAVFDAEAKQIGFGLAAADVEAVIEDEEPPAGAELPPGAQVVDPQPVAVLQNLVMFLLHALAIQVTVVLLLTYRGNYWKSWQLLIARTQTFLMRHGFFTKSRSFAAVVPQSSLPPGHECVICLGSCEEEHAKGKSSPRWCRLKCGHHFHEDCIFEWLWKVQRCPVCRCHMLPAGASDCSGASLPLR